MNKYLLLISILSFSSFAMAKDITISVKGMVCGFCAQGIEKKFKALPEVENVQVSLEKKTVVVKTKENKDLTDKAITEILTDSGYNVEEIKR
jgi:copper chaperone CopZ